jgi:hypothetical protein
MKFLSRNEEAKNRQIEQLIEISQEKNEKASAKKEDFVLYSLVHKQNTEQFSGVKQRKP